MFHSHQFSSFFPPPSANPIETEEESDQSLFNFTRKKVKKKRRILRTRGGNVRFFFIKKEIKGSENQHK